MRALTYPKPPRVVWSTVAIAIFAALVGFTGVFLAAAGETFAGYLFFAVAIGTAASLFQNPGFLFGTSSCIAISAAISNVSGSWTIPSIALAVGLWNIIEQTSYGRLSEPAKVVERESPQVNDILLGKGEIYVVSAVADQRIKAICNDEFGVTRSCELDEFDDLILFGPAEGKTRRRFLRRMALGFLRTSGTSRHIIRAYLIGLVPVMAVLVGGMFLTGRWWIGGLTAAAVALLLYLPALAFSLNIYRAAKSRFDEILPVVKT